MAEKLERLAWKDGKIVDSKSNDLTDKAKGVGGKKEITLSRKKEFKNYVLKLLDDLKKTNKIYEKVNSYVVLKELKENVSSGAIGSSLFTYEFQYSQI